MEMTPALPQLPCELLTQIFLDVDPHTLYTSIRCLSRQWKSHVEERLLRSEFESGRWRLGLRVSRKPKAGKAWRGGVASEQGDQAPGALWARIRSQAEAGGDEGSRDSDLEAARHAYTQSVLSREGALEDELPDAIPAEPSLPLVHVIPLRFNAYDGEATMLHFDTGSKAWYAMFEGGNNQEGGEASSERLDLDFSIVWRFPGDGQSGDEMGGWGTPDQENGWLSRFYCSSFDTRNGVVGEEQETSQVLHSSPLARRIRKRTVSLQQEHHHPDLDVGSSIEWVDQGHEYLSLSLALGTEFFVRRSARANFLMRRLETEARAGEERISAEACRESSPTYTPRLPQRAVARLQGESSATTGCSSGASTPRWAQGSVRLMATYASIASTPPSECPSPRGTPIAMQSRGPRVVRIHRHQQQPEQNGSSGSKAPLPSANVSGYSSVKHQARIDDKDVEASNVSLDSSSPQPPSTTNSPRRDVSGHYSIPRAHFSACLLRPDCSPSWQAADQPSVSPFRRVFPTHHFPLTAWEWRR